VQIAGGRIGEPGAWGSCIVRCESGASAVEDDDGFIREVITNKHRSGRGEVALDRIGVGAGLIQCVVVDLGA